MTLSEFETYFLAFKDDITEIKDVVFGDEEEILNRQSSKISYPCMWVETPQPTFLYDPAGIRLEWPIAFIVNVPRGAGAEERAARSAMLLVAQKAWAKLEAGEAEGRFQFVRNQDEGDPILKYSGDNDTGWRFVARVVVGRDDC